MARSLPLSQEGEVDFHYPAAGKPLKTWYKVVGDLSSGKTPLVILHGGPGAGIGYLMPMQEMVATTGIPMVFYDQIGNGKSTHVREKNGDNSFWNMELFIAQLESLLKSLRIDSKFDLYGQSWGGMLGAGFAIRKPQGLRRLVISNSPAAIELWERAASQFKSQLPQDVQDTLNKHEKAGTIESEEYEAAVMKFLEKHFCRVTPMPKEEVESFELIKDDPTVYHTMNGPHEFYITGNLRGFSLIGQLHNIQVPTFLINGRYDAAQDYAVQPFFEEIPKVKWITLEGCSHSPLYENRERYFEIIGDFLVN